MIDKVSKDDLVIIANLVAANTIEEEINGNGNYYDAVEKFIEMYTVAIKEHLDSSAELAKNTLIWLKKQTMKLNYRK